MSEFVLSKRISDEINIHASENATPFLSFEFFPPKTEVNILLFPFFTLYSFFVVDFPFFLILEWCYCLKESHSTTIRI
jgi:hypothetical protein